MRQSMFAKSWQWLKAGDLWWVMGKLALLFFIVDTAAFFLFAFAELFVAVLFLLPLIFPLKIVEAIFASSNLLEGGMVPFPNFAGWIILPFTFLFIGAVFGSLCDIVQGRKAYPQIIILSIAGVSLLILAIVS